MQGKQGPLLVEFAAVEFFMSNQDHIYVWSHPAQNGFARWDLNSRNKLSTGKDYCRPVNWLPIGLNNSHVSYNSTCSENSADSKFYLLYIYNFFCLIKILLCGKHGDFNWGFSVKQTRQSVF